MRMFPKENVSPFLLGPYLQEQNISSQHQARTASTGHEKCFSLTRSTQFLCKSTRQIQKVVRELNEIPQPSTDSIEPRGLLILQSLSCCLGTW
jgi:hypothetical protein